MLAGEWEEVVKRGNVEEVFRSLVSLYGESSLVFANLEATLVGTEGVISKEPRVISSPDTLRACLRALRIDVANVANNHAFDGHQSGFERLRELLDAEGILFLGAGRDAREAAEPLLVEVKGLKFGWLAYTDPATKPSHVASLGDHGVNLLSSQRTIAEVERLAERVDHVVVSLHWGVEYCHVPAPGQIQFARSLIDSGASLVLGHHAHVIQGVEAVERGVIAYNLGNAAATDLEIGGRLAIRQTSRTRSSFLLRAVFSKHDLMRVELIPFVARFDGVSVADRGSRRILERSGEKIRRGISPSGWVVRRLYEDVLVRTARKLDPKVVGTIRPRHFIAFFKNIVSALRGKGPV